MSNSADARQTAWENFIRWSASDSSGQTIENRVIRFEPDHLFSRILNNSSNNIVIALMDVRSQQYKYISPNAYDIIGWTYEQLIAGGVRFTFDRIHPDDLPGAIAFSELINNYYRQLPEPEKPFYSGQWDYRVRNDKDVYYKYTQKDYVLKHSSDGQIEEYLVFFSKIENYKSPDSQHLRLTNGKESLLYKHDHKCRQTYMLETLTKRETEIVQLISKSYSLKEIASELNISFNTVKNHSNNILKKLEAKDSMEAVNLTRVLGFI
jgi:DNA-binding CsgD family transcriptional regulator